jgi:hypothetical protein
MKVSIDKESVSKLSSQELLTYAVTRQEKNSFFKKELIPLIKKAMKGGAGINRPDEEGYSPLYKAITYGNFKATKYLILSS